MTNDINIVHECSRKYEMATNSQSTGCSGDGNSCVACIEGKQARKTFKKIPFTAATSALELVHSDIWGPISGTSLQVERQTGAKIKSFSTDTGREYVNKEMSDYFHSNGNVHQTTVPYNPQQNGVSEQTIRSVVEKACCMLAESSLSKAFWEDALQTSVYLKNRSPHGALTNAIPFMKWYGHKPNLSHLRVFGCRALIHVPDSQRKKLDLKAVESIFVGYSDDRHNYIFRDVRYPRRLVKARELTFFEECFSNLMKNQSSDETCTSDSDSVPVPLNVLSENVTKN